MVRGTYAGTACTWNMANHNKLLRQFYMRVYDYVNESITERHPSVWTNNCHWALEFGHFSPKSRFKITGDLGWMQIYFRKMQIDPNFLHFTLRLMMINCVPFYNAKICMSNRHCRFVGLKSVDRWDWLICRLYCIERRLLIPRDSIKEINDENTMCFRYTLNWHEISFIFCNDDTCNHSIFWCAAKQFFLI